jgi:Ca2+-binding RTX toxin-like protein
MIRYGTILDDIFGDDENDEFIFGFKGDDTFLSTRGNDSLFGGRGDDSFIIAPQFDGVVHVDGGRGHDTLYLARDVFSIDHVGDKIVIHYLYDMFIIVDNVEMIEYGG